MAHRDVKLDNICFDVSRQRLVLVDLGLATPAGRRFAAYCFSRVLTSQAKPSHYSQQTPGMLGTECPAIAPPRFGLAQRCVCSDAPGRIAQRPRPFLLVAQASSLAGQGGGALAHPLPAAPDFTRYAAQSKNVL